VEEIGYRVLPVADAEHERIAGFAVHQLVAATQSGLFLNVSCAAKCRIARLPWPPPRGLLAADLP
jgi:hypothetical protein